MGSIKQKERLGTFLARAVTSGTNRANIGLQAGWIVNPLLVLCHAPAFVYVPMTEYVAALQADTLSQPLSCATDEHP
ncbi:hypothetical protein [Pseudomonas sp. BW7P1]|uniref:hypothetical protein n=1 Tax=Pseudomonas TaxID=286 RepID=UPI0021ADA710|nr:hypothetical protein [Pseudomonas sp. BW7P1]UWI59541.1 hypothetical protein NWV16_15620 [Pseudomonas sp. BW7P1]